MAWCQIGDKPFSEPMLTAFTEEYMRHLGEVSWFAYILQDCFSVWWLYQFQWNNREEYQYIKSTKHEHFPCLGWTVDQISW